MEKQCYAVKVSEIENGYRFDVTGENVKEILKPLVEKFSKDKGCCGTIIQTCCPDKE